MDQAPSINKDFMLNSILIFNECGSIKYINSVAEKTFGYHIDEIRRQNIDLIVPGLQSNICSANSIYKAGATNARNYERYIETDGLHKSGKIIPLILFIDQMEINNRNMYSAVIHDRTFHNHLEYQGIFYKKRLDSLLQFGTNLSGNFTQIINQIVIDIAELFSVNIVCLSEIQDDKLYFLSVYENGKIINNAGNCPIDITPCSTVKTSRDICIYENVVDMFPQAEFLKKYNAYSYCGFPAYDSKGNVLCVICLLDNSLHKYTSFDREIMSVFAHRIAIELELAKEHSMRIKNHEELRKLTRAVEQSPSLVMITDPKGSINYANPKFSEVTGYTLDELLGEKPSLLKSGNTPDEFYKDLWTTISAGNEWRGEYQNRKKTGDLYWVREIISPIKDENNNIIYYLSTSEDITESKQLSSELMYQASHDFLTGLVNRKEFESRLQRLLDFIDDDKSEHSLCYFDLDEFKIINDTCGHIAGDQLLRQVSELLLKNIRKNDTLARLGGDEFGLLMESCNINNAYRISTDIVNVIKDYNFVWENKLFKIGVSIGLVSINSDTNLTDILKNADTACYIAKEKGGNRVQIHSDKDTSLTHHRKEIHILSKINQAVENGGFNLYAQMILPLDSMHNGSLHYELLLRMKDENNNEMSPHLFLPAAERFKISPKIDRWVIQKAFDWLDNNQNYLDQLSLCSINLSALSLGDYETLKFIKKLTHEKNIPAEKICFEITETAVVYSLSNAIEFMNELIKYGYKFALDDFGRGISSFAYLKQLPINILKIDGMFVKDIDINPVNYAMVKSINEIGQVMGLKTVAEFVESKNILQKLKGIYVNYAQGYYIGKPELWITNNNGTSQ